MTFKFQCFCLPPTIHCKEMVTYFTLLSVSNVLDSDHLPILFNILDHVSVWDISAPVETYTDWERFRSLAYDLISPRIQIDTAEEAEKAATTFAATTFTATTALAYRLSTHTFTLSDLNNEQSGLDHFLYFSQRLRKLRHETRDPACKTARNWVTKTIRRMARRNAI